MRNAIPDVLVSPYTFSGGTDNKWFGTPGIPTYGFTAKMLLPPDYDFSAMFHGADEHVPVESLEFGVDVMCDPFAC
jgi:acetylornithine deacetylase/succinyl-diaminopimelate desuccinylase-like protein